MPDYLVLESVYDRSMAIEFTVGMRIRSEIDGIFYSGTITHIAPHERRERNSPWRAYNVRWDLANGEQFPDDTLSPWDMQPLAATPPPPSPGAAAAAAVAAEVEAAVAVAASAMQEDAAEADKAEDGQAAAPAAAVPYSETIPAAERDRVLAALNVLVRLPIASLFAMPVTRDEAPDYIKLVCLEMGGGKEIWQH